MSITKESELIGMKKVSEVVGTTLKLMRVYAKVGISKETRLNRVIKRNTERVETFEFSRKDFDFMESWFEKPNEKEMDKGIIVTGQKS